MAKKSKFNHLQVIFRAILQSKKNLFVLVETRFGHAFLMDTGSSTGEIMGHSKVSYSTFFRYTSWFRTFTYHSKVINAVSIRPQRPFRAATAGDDSNIVFHSGAPYKYEKVGYSQILFFSLLVYLRISSCRRSTRTVNSFKMWNILHQEIISQVWALIQSSSYMMARQETRWLNSQIVLIKGAL